MLSKARGQRWGEKFLQNGARKAKIGNKKLELQGNV